PRDDTESPDGVIETHPVQHKKQDADCVEQSARDQPDQSGGWNRCEKRLHGNQREPAQGYVNCGGKKLKAIDEPDFEDNSRSRESPDDTQQRPAPSST